MPTRTTVVAVVSPARAGGCATLEFAAVDQALKSVGTPRFASTSVQAGPTVAPVVTVAMLALCVRTLLVGVRDRIRCVATSAWTYKPASSTAEAAMQHVLAVAVAASATLAK
jgi:hypothetical protein